MKTRTSLVTMTLFGLMACPIMAQASHNCPANDMMSCGATSKSDFKNTVMSSKGDGHHSGASLRKIYTNRGITITELMSSDTVNGTVTKSGNVMVDGKVVATDARSEGRQQITGSTKDGDLWIRPTSVSFESDSLPAWVHMKNGQFEWAIIKSCGNIVKAKAKPAPTKSKSSPVKTQVQQQVQVQTVTINTTPAPTPAPTPAAKPLPATGDNGAPYPAAGLAGASVISIGMGAYIRGRQKLAAILRSA